MRKLNWKIKESPPKRNMGHVDINTATSRGALFIRTEGFLYCIGQR